MTIKVTIEGYVTVQCTYPDPGSVSAIGGSASWGLREQQMTKAAVDLLKQATETAVKTIEASRAEYSLVDNNPRLQDL